MVYPKVVSGWTVLCLLCAVTACGADAQSPDEQYYLNLREGVALLKQKNHARAMARFKFAKKFRPESSEIYYWIGLTFSEMANYRSALTFAEKATVLNPEDADGWLLWGQCLLYLQQWKEAKVKLDRAHRLAPKHPLVVFNIGRCYYHGLDNKAMALDFFRKVLKLPKHPKVSNQKALQTQTLMYAGCCYQAKDLPQAAIRVFQQALKLDPGLTEAYFRLGIAYRSTGKSADALKMFQETVQRNPDHYEAHLQLGHIYLMDLPDPELSRIHLERFYKKAPRDHAWRERVYNYYAEQAKKAKEGKDKKKPAPDTPPPAPPM